MLSERILIYLYLLLCKNNQAEKLISEVLSNELEYFRLSSKMDEQNIYNVLLAEDLQHIDLISLKSGFKLSALSFLLMGMELNGVIKAFPGNRYSLN